MKKINKMRLSLIITACVLFVAYMIVLISDAVAVNAYNQQDHVVNIKDCRTDPEALQNVFPIFGEIRECFWDAGVTRKETLLGSLVDIGPTQYWLNCYFVLDSADMNRIVEEYGLTVVDDPENPHFQLINDQMEISGSEWLKSGELDLAFSRYHGDLYLNKENNIVIFDFIRD